MSYLQFLYFFKQKKDCFKIETVSCKLLFKLLIASLYKICQVFSFQ